MAMLTDDWSTVCKSGPKYIGKPKALVAGWAASNKLVHIPQRLLSMWRHTVDRRKSTAVPAPSLQFRAHFRNEADAFDR